VAADPRAAALPWRSNDVFDRDSLELLPRCDLELRGSERGDDDLNGSGSE
jgi:hypothetical protein